MCMLKWVFVAFFMGCVPVESPSECLEFPVDVSAYGRRVDPPCENSIQVPAH